MSVGVASVQLRVGCTCVLVVVRVGNVFGVDKRCCPRPSLAHQVKLCALRLFSVGSVVE